MSRQNRLEARTADLGGKLGPRIADLVAQSVLATRRGLATHEARVLAAGLARAVDQMGTEHAAFIRPFTDQVIAGEHMPEELREWFARAASGAHQWESRALTGALVGGAQGALGQVISNYVAPVAYALIRQSPNLDVDPQTAAAAVAAGIIPASNAYSSGRDQGFGQNEMNLLIEASQQIPAGPVLLELLNRGVLSEADVLHWLGRGAIPAALRPAIVHLARVLLTPADAALGVLRGNLTEAEGRAIAAHNGIDAADFQTLIDNTGEPLGLMQLLEAFRRGFIDRARLERGIRQSRVRNEWIPVAEQLRYEPMSTADAADAALRGHLTPEQAADIANLNGLRPQDWPAYFANQGNPPAPEQLLELWRRGYIDQGRVRLGLKEGRTRDEWIADVEQLRYEPISSADAVDAWLRGHINLERAHDLMSENGLIPRDQDIALANAGNPLGLEELLEAFRRGLIDEARFVHGFRESRYRDEWAQIALKLRYRPMSTADAVQAAVQGHLSIEAARDLAEENGLLPADFMALYETAGEPLSRTELEQLYNRGLIDAATVEQGLRESRLKNKYIENAVKLHVRMPEERAILQLVEFGALPAAEATLELQKLGYTPAYAAAFVHEAEARATGGHRQLATSQVSALYEQHLIGRAEAEQLLEQLHYTAGTAAMVLNLADHTRRMRILDTGITAVRAQFVKHRSSELEATADLAALKVPSDAIALYMTVWQLERKAEVRTLSEAQIVKAYTKNLFDPDQQINYDVALGRLEQLGYSPADSALLLAGA